MSTREYWKKKEIEFQKKKASILANSRIKWISREKFWSIFESEYRIGNRYLDKEIYFPIMLEELRARISEPPVYTPLEEDFPGPVERWYGFLDNHIFTLTHYYHVEKPELTLVSMEDDEDIEKIILDALTEFKALKLY